MTSSAQKPATNVQRAIHQLRDKIFSGELAAGSDHLESELAEVLSMSRTPVREAVLTLETQGLLELRPRKGVRILPISPEDMAEVYDVLTELESLAAARAAAFGYSAQELAPLDRAIGDMDIAIHSSNLEDWAEADDRFHRELVRLGRNSRAISIVEMMSDQVRRARSMTLFMRPLPTKSNEDHREVFRAIMDGDAAKARQTHREHREHAKQMIVELLKRHRLRYV
ncbi:GntR family transcriptional regulator [Pontivivens insulae]|uniref:HTH-type transcriptional repressor RspR n=1 Tax=Pontivivens insulae TaxID=1639689 RepID=A0A2R8AFI1_9RHOB|nr:GntR family transcriptional regulator [Pontivivens insulae]RED12180.1 GntR family transcriptional regulator [Pontivivens insulae]SPF30936.1 HTH-type transcriptional repressor RspR [Pontivivens insulae]